MANQGPRRPDEGFPVDDCFGQGIDRALDGLVNGGVDGRELITFEEFIRSTSRKGNRKRMEGVDRADDDFFDIMLDGGVPDDPISPEKTGARATSVAKRGELYMVPEDESKLRPTSTAFRQSLCPTVGEGGGWLSGRTRRESQDSAAYGYDPPEEPSPAPKVAKMEQAAGGEKRSVKGSCSKDSLHACSEQRTAEDNRQMVQSNSYSNLIFSKFLCCFRALNPNQMAKGRKLVGSEMEQQHGGGENIATGIREEQQQPKVYSWDTRDDNTANPNDFRFSGLIGETRVKEPGQLGGQAFQIENCADSLIVLLDHTASITIDESRNCVILAGPCQGSLFLRDCKNMLVLAVCQQFRTRDCSNLAAHLFCGTAPTIEETDMTLGPLLLNYSGLQMHMFSAGLSPFVNRWNQVHNFTPEAGKCHLLHGTFPTANSLNFDIVQRFGEFVHHSPIAEKWNLTVGKMRESRLFVDGLGVKKGENNNDEERALVLIQPAEAVSASQRFYMEAVEITHELLNWASAKLAAMHDVDLRSGEWEAIMRQKPKTQKSKTSGKIIAIEIVGADVVKNADTVCRSSNRVASVAQLVSAEHAAEYKKQLYRLCEIRQNI